MTKARAWFRIAAAQKARREAAPKIVCPPFIARCVRALKPGEAMTIRGDNVALIKMIHVDGDGRRFAYRRKTQWGK